MHEHCWARSNCQNPQISVLILHPPSKGDIFYKCAWTRWSSGTPYLDNKIATKSLLLLYFFNSLLTCVNYCFERSLNIEQEWNRERQEINSCSQRCCKYPPHTQLMVNWDRMDSGWCQIPEPALSAEGCLSCHRYLIDEDGMGVMLCITQAPKGQNAKFIVCLFWVNPALSCSSEVSGLSTLPQNICRLLDNVRRKILDSKVCPEWSYVYNPHTLT